MLYLHSKGVTARYQAEPAHTRVYQWRTAMSYFLIYHHRAMIRLLDDFDVVGVHVKLPLTPRCQDAMGIDEGNRARRSDTAIIAAVAVDRP